MDSNEINLFAKQFGIKKILRSLCCWWTIFNSSKQTWFSYLQYRHFSKSRSTLVSSLYHKNKKILLWFFKQQFSAFTTFYRFYEIYKKRINMEHNSNSVQYFREMWNPLFGFLLCYVHVECDATWYFYVKPI